MQIIGAGFGRTGTMSLKSALQKLGFEPCYHMLEVLQHPKHIAFWMGVAEGQEINWDEILGKYQSGVDYPLAIYYKELMAAYRREGAPDRARPPEMVRKHNRDHL